MARQAGDARPRPGPPDHADTGLALYAGNDDLLYPFLELGGNGGVCVASHVAGPQMRRMIDARPSGDMDAARAPDEALHDLYAALAVTTNPIPVKAALNLLGHDVGRPAPAAGRGGRRPDGDVSPQRSRRPASSSAARV